MTVVSKSIYCPDFYLNSTGSLSALSPTVIIDFFPNRVAGFSQSSIFFESLI